MTATGAFALGALLVWSLIFLRGLRGVAKTPVLTPRPDNAGAVTAYVPARNEAEVVEAAVLALRAQPQVRGLVVVDDRSEDGTRAILERQDGLTIVEGRGPGPGECGKPAALVQAYAEAPPDTDWVLFVDADVVLTEGAVGALLAEAEASGADLVTLVPRVTLGSLPERVVMPAVGALVLAHHPPERVNDPGDPKAFANGQVILLRRSLYEQVGGHRSVIGAVLEDVELARAVKAAGGRLRVVDGRHLARTRMYDGWAELAEGWTKNLYLLMDADLAVAVRWSVLTVVLGSLGWIALAVDQSVLGLSAWGAIVTMQGTLRFKGGTNPLYAVLAPIGAVAAASLLLKSARRHRGAGGVTWKGRTY